jgi:hypothetical protein
MGILSNTGRPANDIIYQEVSFNGKYYIIGYVLYKDTEHKFIFDKEDYETVSKYSWHITSNNYISTSYTHDDKRKSLYLHNLVMNRDAFNGKGQKESIDHINRIGFDNRKENLRLITQSEQNINQVKKKRSIILPSKYNIKPEDIPRHIWYVRENGLHGDRFAIEFKTEGIVWKTTSSKKIDINTKLSDAKNKLEELYALYPHLDPKHAENECNILEDSYNSIISLSYT